MINKAESKCMRLYYKYLFLIAVQFFLFFFTNNGFGQHKHDNTHFALSKAEKHSLVFSDSALNAVGIDVLLNKIQNVHSTLNRINTVISIGYDTRDIDNNFPEIDSSIDIIAENLSLYNTVLDVKNLQLFNDLIADIQNRLSEWRDLLFKYNKDVVSMQGQLASFKKDTILTALMTDSAFVKIYRAELTDLKSDWRDAERLTDTSFNKINDLQATLSNEYFETIDLDNKNRDLLRKTGSKSIGKEYDYLWEVHVASPEENRRVHELVKKSFIGQRRILAYYFKRNWDDQLWMFLTGVVIFIWIYRNFKQLEKYTARGEETEFGAVLIRKISILPTLIVLFNIAPFYDIHPPSTYVEIMQLLLVEALTLLLRKRWPKDLFDYWLQLGFLYIVLSFTGTFLTPGLSFRLILLLLNIISVVFGFKWIRTIKKHTLAFSEMIKTVSVIYIVLNIAGIFCNLFGRLSLAKILSITAVFGLTQIAGLSVFMIIAMEAFELQLTVNRLRGGLTARLNFDRIRRLIRSALMILSVCIWIIVFTISLNLYNVVLRAIENFLNKPRKIGSTSFEIGNFLLFIFIIYISNLLQQGIGSLYGKTEDTWDPQIRKNSSRLAMTRLLLIIAGFLIAIAASGLPIDKVTIVLGALGVGIGLGLQSIVNNLVSGVILIFEQPFRIGDFIELGDKKGRVLDIGIRSSKLVMEEGAEVIMPNGDLLSGRVINWTLRDDNVRIEMPISVEPGHSFEEIQKKIMEVISNSEHVLKNTRSEILLTAITDKIMSVDILVWINNVNKIQSIRSELLNKIHEFLLKNDIKMI